MNKQFRLSLSFLTLTAFSGYTFADCALPESPIVPDGNVASEDELVAAQKAMKAYQAKLGDYRLCLDDQQTALDPEAETSVEAIAEITANYDASVDAESVIAEEFNVAVRAFKARQE